MGRIVILVLIALLLLLQIRLWNQYYEVRQLRAQMQEQQASNQQLLQRNAELAAEVDNLQQGLEAVEERARTELGFIKEDEEFYQVIEEQQGE